MFRSVYQQTQKWQDSDLRLLKMTEDVDYDVEGIYTNIHITSNNQDRCMVSQRTVELFAYTVMSR